MRKKLIGVMLAAAMVTGLAGWLWQFFRHRYERSGS